jgi:hypothetical protein
MHVMLTNKGPTPLPIGSPDAGGFEGLLPPGLDIFLARDDIETLIFGEQPDAAGRSKRSALGREVDPDSPLAVEYGTNIDQWKGRSDPGAETAVMNVVLGIKNVGLSDVTITTTEGDVTYKPGEGGTVETVAGAGLVGAPYVPPEPPVDDGFAHITSFTATLDPTCTVVDASMLDAGDTLTLTAVAGLPEATILIDGHVGTVYDLAGNTFRLSGVDLTGVDVTDLAATGAVTPVVDTTGTITAFTAADPTEASMDAEDQAMIQVGDFLTLEALAGTPEAMAAINGLMVEVLTVAPTTLGIDLSLVDVTGLTADFVIG